MAKVFVTTYGKYNAGYGLTGNWFDLEGFSDKAEFIETAEKFVNEADPELMFTDWEGIPSGMIGECWIAPELWDWLALDDADKAIVEAYRDNVDEAGTIETALEAYGGEFPSKADWAEDFLDGTGAITNDFVRRYFDYDLYARDARLSGFVSFARSSDGYVKAFFRT
jgi:antirestriction protein